VPVAVPLIEPDVLPVVFVSGAAGCGVFGAVGLVVPVVVLGVPLVVPVALVPYVPDDVPDVPVP